MDKPSSLVSQSPCNCSRVKHWNRPLMVLKVFSYLVDSMITKDLSARDVSLCESGCLTWRFKSSHNCGTISLRRTKHSNSKAEGEVLDGTSP